VTQNGPGGAVPPAAAAGAATAPTGAGPADVPPGVVELLGVLAYALLVAFFRLTEDAALAESLADKAALGEMAVAEFGQFQMVRGRIQELNVEPDEAMRPFVDGIDEFHARTAPSDWLEGLVKAYVGDGISADFCRMVAGVLDPTTRELVLAVRRDAGHAEFAAARVRQAIEADPRLAGRLGLWARRLVGEALGQAQRVAAEHEALAGLLAGGEVTQLGEIGRMFAQLTDAHARRMAALGLAE
jgi:tRNA-(MS[2]IO[6]A)-hydroxylase (MiaE)-like